MDEQVEAGAGTELEMVQRMEGGLQSLRTVGAMVVGVFLAGGVALPLATPPAWQLGAIAITGFWAVVIVLLTWRSPRLMAAAGAAPLIIGLALLLGNEFTVAHTPEELSRLLDAPGPPLQLVVVGALLIGGSGALTIDAVREVETASLRREATSLYSPGRLALGAVAGVGAGLALHVHGWVPAQLDEAGPLFSAGFAIILGVAAGVSPAASPIAVPVAVLVLFLAKATFQWPSTFYAGEDQPGQLTRHAVQLCLVLAVAGASLVPARQRWQR